MTYSPWVSIPKHLLFAKPSNESDRMATRVTASGNRVWEDESGLLEREGAPALIAKDGRLEYYRRGLRHRDDGPAVIYPDGSVEYWLFGVEVDADDVGRRPAGRGSV